MCTSVRGLVINGHATNGIFVHFERFLSIGDGEDADAIPGVQSWNSPNDESRQLQLLRVGL